MKIEIKSVTNKILFSYECENNTFKTTIGEAILTDADLWGADLRDADLRSAKNIPYIPLACPSDGEFIGWKKVDDFLIQLLIPGDAKRSSGTTAKCRCDKAFVISIKNIKTGREKKKKINKDYTPYITYEVGKIVYPDSFDEDRFNECSSGIHFFINKQDAINY